MRDPKLAGLGGEEGGVRPAARSNLDHFIGQEAIKADVRARIRVARERSTPLPHMLLCGPPEMGKVALIQAIASEMDVPLKRTSARDIQTERDFAALLTALESGDLLSISEIQSLSKGPYDLLLSPVEGNYTLDVVVGAGPGARSLKIPLKRFTLIATTSRPSQIEKRLRRWLIVHDFAPYSESEIAQIIALLGQRKEESGQETLPIDPDAARLLAERSEGSPGNAAVLLRRVQGFASPGRITLPIAREALTSFGYLGRPPTNVDLASTVRAMDGVEFEAFVATVFREKGFAVEVTGKSGDHGIDLLMRKSERGTIAVKCKCWSGVVGEPTLRDFYGAMMSAGIPLGYVVTAGPFSSEATAFAAGKPIRLLDLDGLLALKLYGREP